MDWYGFLLNNLPPIYKNENTLKKYKIISKSLETAEKCIESLKYINTIDLCTDQELLVLASNLGMVKNENDSFELFRKLVKIEYYKVFIIPTHNNIKKIIKKTTGFYPSLIPLWYRGPQTENDQGYSITYDIPLDFDQRILESSEKVIGAGIKIVREFLFKVEGIEFLNASSVFDTDTIKIGGE